MDAGQPCLEICEDEMDDGQKPYSQTNTTPGGCMRQPDKHALIEVEQGQAADGTISGVLESQNNSLVYYAIMVNDVYAYFLTGQKDGQIQPGVMLPQFPTTMSDLNAITGFAS